MKPITDVYEVVGTLTVGHVEGTWTPLPQVLEEFRSAIEKMWEEIQELQGIVEGLQGIAEQQEVRRLEDLGGPTQEGPEDGV